MKFKVGDRALADDGYVKGTGTIISIEQDGGVDWCGVEMDEPYRGSHTLDGRCPEGRGRWFREEHLRPLEHVFKVGDRVAAAVDHPDNNSHIMKGDEGTVCRVFGGARRVSVEWDEQIGGHSCGGSCPDGYGWNVNVSDLMPFEGHGVDEEKFLEVIL